MAKIVSSWNDWDPLKRVIVGRCDNSVIPPEEPATSEKVPVDSEMRGMWGLRPSDTVARGNECLENLVKILEDRGVVVDRPTPLQWNQAIGTPDFRNDSMMTCMPPRDILLTIGNEIMAAANSFRCRYYEYLAYWPLMEEYFEQDPDFKWTQAPRPRLTDRSYKHNYYDEKISLEERLERTAAKDFVTTEVEPMWDAADVMRMGKGLFIQHGLTTNRAAMDWFQRYYPEYRVHAVNFPGDPYPIHIDATFVPLRPGLIINNPHRPLPEPQRAIFEANDWQIVEAAQPAHTEPPALCYSSVWLSMNCLVHRPEDRHRGGLRGLPAGADGQAGHERHPLRPARRLPVRRRPALLHRRRLPRGRVPRLLPEPRRGSHPRAPRDVEVNPTRSSRDAFAKGARFGGLLFCALVAGS